MNLKINIIILSGLLLLSADCKKAVFNHITEGAGGVLIGFSNHAAGNKILVSGNPETLNEGEEVKGDFSKYDSNR